MIDATRSEPSERGKTVRQLIQELLAMDNLELEVKLSLDGGKQCKAVDSVKSVGDQVVLISHLNEKKLLGSGWFI